MLAGSRSRHVLADVLLAGAARHRHHNCTSISDMYFFVSSGVPPPTRICISSTAWVHCAPPPGSMHLLHTGSVLLPQLRCTVHHLRHQCTSSDPDMHFFNNSGAQCTTASIGALPLTRICASSSSPVHSAPPPVMYMCTVGVLLYIISFSVYGYSPVIALCMIHCILYSTLASVHFFGAILV